MMGAGLLAVVLVVGVLILALAAEHNANPLRGPLERFVSARIGRRVRIAGDLKLHLLSWTPSATLEGLRVGNPAWIGPGDTLAVDRLTIAVRLAPLFIGRVELALVRMERPQFALVRDRQGRESWQGAGSAAGRPIDLPPIQQLVIADGGLGLIDAQRHLRLSASVQAREDAAGPTPGGLRLSGQGLINGAPFGLQASGGPLIKARRDRPYPFDLDVRAGATHLTAQGFVTRPFNLGYLSGQVQAAGPSLSDLYDLTGAVLPSTPPYRLSARFVRAAARVDFSGMTGVVGSTDLRGALSVDRINNRRTVTADLVSQRLNMADLLTMIGGSPAQRRRGGPPAAPVRTADRLLPDAPLYRDRLNTMDATVRYQAGSVKTTYVPLRRAALTLTLNHGLLTLDPVSFDMASGRLTGSVRIDARQAVPHTDLDVRLSNVALQQFFFRPASGPPALEGVLQARAVLHGTGDSIRKAAATANGRVVVAAPGGRVRQAFAELLGINIGKGLYLLLSNNTRDTPLRCAVADFAVQDGVMRAGAAVVDTGVVRAEGSGTIDLGAEALDLKLTGQTKQPRLLRVLAPITIKGTLAHPKVGVDAGKAGIQAGAAVALATVLTPLALILPFVDPGLAKDANCAGLLADAQTRGVRGAARPKAAAAAPRQR